MHGFDESVESRHVQLLDHAGHRADQADRRRAHWLKGIVIPYPAIRNVLVQARSATHVAQPTVGESGNVLDPLMPTETNPPQSNVVASSQMSPDGETPHCPLPDNDSDYDRDRDEDDGVNSQNCINERGHQSPPFRIVKCAQKQWRTDEHCGAEVMNSNEDRREQSD